MKETLIQNAEAVARDWQGLLFAGLGVTFLPHEWLGGMFLALAGASLATTLDSESRRLTLFGTLTTAFFVAHLAGMAAQSWYPPLSPQMVMAVSGFASRYLARLALRFIQRLESRSVEISDRVIDRYVPPSKKERPDEETPPAEDMP